MPERNREERERIETFYQARLELSPGLITKEPKCAWEKLINRTDAGEIKPRSNSRQRY
jgi:hypothetical protein